MKQVVTKEQVERHLDACDQELIGVERWTNHDWIVARDKPDAEGKRNITRSRVILTVHLEDLPLSSLEQIWPEAGYPARID